MVKSNEKNKKPMKKDEPIPFLVNRTGFPIDGDTWERMWQFASAQYLDKKDNICSARHAKHLPRLEMPVIPTLAINKYINVWEFSMAVQEYLDKLQYNHTGTQFFEIKKNKSLTGLMETAKSMIQESLPIKCLESVILSIYLTNGLSNMERFPINFKSRFCGRNYYHVVLGIYYAGVYGTLGLSRRSDLMYKPLLHKSLSDLIYDFVNCYRRYRHRVIKVTIGTYVPHDPSSGDRIIWKGLSLHMSRMLEENARKEIDKYARQMRNNAIPPMGPIILPPQGLVTHLNPKKRESTDDMSIDLVHNLIEGNDDLTGFCSYKLRI